ncbi:MAG: hypothetical protein ACE3JP_02010 [Ectobacillus sp.]
MSHPFPHPNRAAAGENAFPDTTDSIAEIQDFQECTSAFAHVGNTFFSPDESTTTVTIIAGSTIPLRTVLITDGFRLESNGALLFKDCGTFAITLKVAAFLDDVTGDDVAGTFIDLVKLGCEGRQTFGSILASQLLVRGFDTVIVADECLQTGERLQLELRGNDIGIIEGILDINLVVEKTSCCCSDDCDKCDCPCKKHHR